MHPSHEHKEDLRGKLLKQGGFLSICHEMPDMCIAHHGQTIHPSHMVLRSPVTYPELFQQSGNFGLYEEHPSGSGHLCKWLARPETCT